MALLKNKITKFGIEANYWKIGMLTIDRLSKQACCSVYLYMNQQASISNPQGFVDCQTVTSLMHMDGDKAIFNQYFDGQIPYKDVYNAFYEYLKENEEYFKDAVDC